jgi:hypothetical protein
VSLRKRIADLIFKIKEAAEPGSGCTVCERPGRDAWPMCKENAVLTIEQWRDHAEVYYDEAREHNAAKDNAWLFAERRTEERYGPCPPEPSLS